MTAKKTTNRNCLIPNEGGFRPAGPVVFNELAIDLILTTSANLGARVVASLVPGRMGRFILKRPAPEERGGGSTDVTGGAVEDTHLYSRTESCGDARFSSALEGYRHSGSDFIASSDVHRGRM